MLCCLAAALAGLGEPLGSGRWEGMMSGLGRWGKWWEKKLPLWVCKSTIWKWLWFVDYLDWWGVEAEEQLPSWTGTFLGAWETCLWDGGWCDGLGWWCVRPATGGREAGRQHKPGVGRDDWCALKGKGHGSCCVSNWEAQCCEEMAREWNIGELCKKCLKGWSIEVVLCCTCSPTKFCVSFFPFYSLWACSRFEPLLPTNVFSFFITKHIIKSWGNCWCDVSPLVKCGVPTAVIPKAILSILISLPTWCMPEEGISRARESVTLLLRVRSHFLDFHQGIHWIL